MCRLRDARDAQIRRYERSPPHPSLGYAENVPPLPSSGVMEVTGLGKKSVDLTTLYLHSTRPSVLSTTTAPCLLYAAPRSPAAAAASHACLSPLVCVAADVCALLRTHTARSSISPCRHSAGTSYARVCSVTHCLHDRWSAPDHRGVASHALFSTRTQAVRCTAVVRCGPAPPDDCPSQPRLGRQAAPRGA